MPTFKIMTGARLHFGLLDTRSPFGGAGIMIDRPETEIQFHPGGPSVSVATSAEQPNSLHRQAESRVREIYDRFVTTVQPPSQPQVQILVRHRPQPHTGLGTGTQLAMAIAEGLLRATGKQALLSAEFLADIGGRGIRSAVGVHGYCQGGFIYEAADATSETKPIINPVVERLDVPSQWRVVLFEPRYVFQRVSGNDEASRFARLPRPNTAQRIGLRSILEHQIIPALKEADFSNFGQAVFQYNLASGRFFAETQGGAYNGTMIHEWIKRLRAYGLEGVGQSSWGPSVFAFVEDQQTAESVVSTCVSPDYRATIVRPLNTARRMESL